MKRFSKVGMGSSNTLQEDLIPEGDNEEELDGTSKNRKDKAVYDACKLDS